MLQGTLAALAGLEEAAADLEAIRGSFVQSDSTEREKALLGVVSGTEKVYELAIQISAIHLENGRAAFDWLERAKSRVFLDILALTSLRSPATADPALLVEERSLLEKLGETSTGMAALDIGERLQAVWDRLAADPHAAEYVAMRRGAPLGWEEVRSLLRSLSPRRRAVLAAFAAVGALGDLDDIKAAFEGVADVLAGRHRTGAAKGSR